MALEQMEGFELAGRMVSNSLIFDFPGIYGVILQLRVNTVHEKGTARYTQQDSLDDSGGELRASLVDTAASSNLFPTI